MPRRPGELNDGCKECGEGKNEILESHILPGEKIGFALCKKCREKHGIK